MVTDPAALYCGAVLDDQSIVPIDGQDAILYPTRFCDWPAEHKATR